MSLTADMLRRLAGSGATAEMLATIAQAIDLLQIGNQVRDCAFILGVFDCLLSEWSPPVGGWL